MTTSEQLYLAIAATVVSLMALIWLVGGLAGLLFGGGWPSVSAADMAATVLRLPSHLGDPRAAWPRAARESMPGAVGFYASGVLIGGLICGVVLGIRRTGISPERIGLGRRRRVPTARWATQRDLAPLRVPETQPGRLTFGKFGRSLLAAEERQSVIFFAPTGTHKTSGLAIPVLLEWTGRSSSPRSRATSIRRPSRAVKTSAK